MRSLIPPARPRTDQEQDADAAEQPGEYRRIADHHRGIAVQAFDHCGADNKGRAYASLGSRRGFTVHATVQAAAEDKA